MYSTMVSIYTSWYTTLPWTLVWFAETLKKTADPDMTRLDFPNQWALQLKFAADRLTDRFLRGRSAGSCGKNKVVSWHKSSPPKKKTTQTPKRHRQFKSYLTSLVKATKGSQQTELDPLSLVEMGPPFADHQPRLSRSTVVAFHFNHPFWGASSKHEGLGVPGIPQTSDLIRPG